MGLWGELKDIPLEMRSQRFGQKQQVETWTRRIPVGAVSKHPDDKVLCVDLITPSVVAIQNNVSFLRSACSVLFCLSRSP